MNNHRKNHRSQPKSSRALKAKWCECEEVDLFNSIYMPDDFCPCGVDKHHYHCPDCRGISQVG